ncbi:MAG: helix-turn-helix transcriptional regulator [Sandaracinaceae bacterium]|nr:helix-turn-helix transcriptional regulator [Sandaracinaceae bacterium]
MSPPDDADAERAPLIPVPAHDLVAHELPGGAVLLAFDLEPGPRDAEPELLDALTPAERRVARLALEGLRDEEIATATGLSRHTVSNQLRRAYARLGVGSRFELCARVRGAR